MSFIGTPVRVVRRGIEPGSYTGGNRVPAILTLWFILLLIAAARNGGLPDKKHALALGVATVVVALIASVAPRIVFWLVLAGVVAVAAQNSDLIVNYIDAGNAKLQAALGARGG